MDKNRIISIEGRKGSNPVNGQKNYTILYFDQDGRIKRENVTGTWDEMATVCKALATPLPPKRDTNPPG